MVDLAATAQMQTHYMALVRTRRMYGGLMLGLFVILLVIGYSIVEERSAGGFIDGLPMLFDFPAGVLSEAWEKRADLPALIWQYTPALIETINIAAASTLIGALAGTFLALLSTRDLARWPRLAPLFRRVMDIMRAFPEVVIALVLIFVLGGGPVPAMIAIAIHTAGALGKLFAEVAENADLKPVEGLQSTGANWSQRMALGILPQVAPNWFSYALMRFEINIRASAILGFVGAGGIGYELKNAMTFGMGKFDQAAAIFILLFVTIVVVDNLSDRVRQRLVKGAPA